jgi:hypothetical protein
VTAEACAVKRTNAGCGGIENGRENATSGSEEECSTRSAADKNSNLFLLLLVQFPSVVKHGLRKFGAVFNFLELVTYSFDCPQACKEKAKIRFRRQARLLKSSIRRRCPIAALWLPLQRESGWAASLYLGDTAPPTTAVNPTIEAVPMNILRRHPLG